MDVPILKLGVTLFFTLFLLSGGYFFAAPAFLKRPVSKTVDMKDPVWIALPVCFTSFALMWVCRGMMPV